MKKNIVLCLALAIVVGLGYMVWKKEHPVVQNLQSAGFTIPSDWISYRNEELHVSFSYPKELGEATAGFDTYPGIKGNEFSGEIAPSSDPTNPQFIFGGSSADYNGTGVEVRSTGFADQINSWNTFVSDAFMTISPIETNSLQGKLVLGTGKCDGAYCLPADTGDASHPAYLAVFQLPENTRGIQVLGLESYSMQKEDFLKILSTFQKI